MAFLIDTNVVWFFFEAGQKDALKSIANVVPLAVVEEVHQEALNHKKRGDEYRKWQLSSGLTVRSLAVGGVGSVCLGTLRGGSNDMKDLGEHASIALAVEDPSLLLVTNDKGGAWLGLRELVAERGNSPRVEPGDDPRAEERAHVDVRGATAERVREVDDLDRGCGGGHRRVRVANGGDATGWGGSHS